jgi:alcohol dehydrogenase, propanol-preferring
VRAVTLERFGAPLVVSGDAPEPVPGPDEALVRVVAAGVCGTDVKLWRGQIPSTPLPLVMGHEVAGELESGQRVVLLHHLFCGSCARCRAGQESLCDRLVGRVGFDQPGGWADYVVVPRRNAVPIPEGVGWHEACVVPDAVATVWRALRTIGGVGPDDDVAIVGLGGLGLAAVQLAVRYGGRVLAVDVDASKLEVALELGASHAALLGEAPRDFDPALVLDCAGTADALRLLPKRGTLVQVGYSDRALLPTAEIAMRELRVVGCRAAALGDLVAALDAVAEGVVRPVVGTVRPLEDAQDAIDALARGEVTGRQVLDVSSGGPGQDPA